MCLICKFTDYVISSVEKFPYVFTQCEKNVILFRKLDAIHTTHK